MRGVGDAERSDRVLPFRSLFSLVFLLHCLHSFHGHLPSSCLSHNNFPYHTIIIISHPSLLSLHSSRPFLISLAHSVTLPYGSFISSTIIPDQHLLAPFFLKHPHYPAQNHTEKATDFGHSNSSRAFHSTLAHPHPTPYARWTSTR